MGVNLLIIYVSASMVPASTTKQGDLAPLESKYKTVFLTNE